MNTVASDYEHTGRISYPQSFQACRKKQVSLFQMEAHIYWLMEAHIYPI